MARFLILSCLLLLSLSSADLSPLFAITQNPSTPILLTYNNLALKLKEPHVTYLYLDIITARDARLPHTKLITLLKDNPTYTVRHSSVVNPIQLQAFKQSLIPFTPQNTYTEENITLSLNKTGKIEIDETNLTPQFFEQISPETMVVLHFKEKASRLLQAVTQTQTSPMLSVMTPSALSGILVSLFLLVVLLIAVGCLMDLKTNDRFPRSVLQVGKES